MVLKKALENWVVIKADLQEYKEFLDGAYLVLIHGKGQVVLGKDHSAPLPEAAQSDDLSVEVRFPAVNIEAIQALKEHALVDSEKTPKTAASICVVLKKQAQ